MKVFSFALPSGSLRKSLFNNDTRMKISKIFMPTITKLTKIAEIENLI